jgi:hypothetical protein
MHYMTLSREVAFESYGQVARRTTQWIMYLNILMNRNYAPKINVSPYSKKITSKNLELHFILSFGAGWLFIVFNSWLFYEISR